MSQQAKLPALEGKKKFTATVSALVMGFLGLLVTNGVIGTEVASTATQIMAIAMPLAAAFVYDIMQGLHDRKKEEVKKIEVEQRFLLEKGKPPPAVPPALPKRINFKTFTREVQERLTQDELDRPATIGLYHAIVDEGKQTPVECLEDVWEYAQLVEDAAQKKFAAIHKFRLDDPDLPKILQKIGKCPYSNVDAFCAYEGNRTALRDCRSATRNGVCVWRLIELDTEDSWRTAYDTSLDGLYRLACHLIANLQRKGE